LAATQSNCILKEAECNSTEPVLKKELAISVANNADNSGELKDLLHEIDENNKNLV